MTYEGPKRRGAAAPYEGPERRRDPAAERANRIGEWLLDRAGIIAGAVVVIYLALAVISVAVVSTNRRAKDQLQQLERVLAGNEETLDLLRGCITPGEQCAEDLARQEKATREAIVEAIGCILLTPPEERTEELVSSCYDRYLPGGEGVPKEGKTK